jgi:hypothetical protein
MLMLSPDRPLTLLAIYSVHMRKRYLTLTAVAIQNDRIQLAIGELSPELN